MSSVRPSFKRQVLGYRRKAVDEYLAELEASIAELQDQLERVTHPDAHDLALRATRLAVEEILQAATDDAASIRAAAASGHEGTAPEIDRVPDT